MPRLFLCEKPSQARDIALVLGATQRQEGHLSGSGILVTWAFGHLLALAAPEDYDPELKLWSFAALPIIPDPWVWKVRKESAAQFKVIAKLLKLVDEVVIATDADREGEAIAREILERERWPGEIKRLWLSALDEVSIQKALNNLLPGARTKPLYDAAVARSKADWLVGMNLSRAYTLSAQAAGLEGVMSVGRVQTPTLKLVVDRDRLIENFKPLAFFDVAIHCHSEKGYFVAHWQVPEAMADSEGRCLNKQAAEQVVLRVKGQTVTVVSAETQLKQEPAPLTFDLSTLQLEASRRFGFGAQQVLDLAQALYETHKIITYPRSDAAYLPVSQHAEVPLVFQALSTQAVYKGLLDKADHTLKSRVWNDQKISAHHAIIPTQKVPDTAHLSSDEQKLYDLIVRHYIVQFYPVHQYQQTVLVVQVGQDQFKVSGKATVDPGWKEVINNKPKGELEGKEDGGEAESGEAATTLPALLEQETALIKQARVETKATKAPPRFTEGTLIHAMKNIASLVENPALKKCLKDTSGIGTEATRAGIIETLLKRGFITQVKKKTLLSSDKARTLIDALPEPVKDPAMTAIWEQALDEIAQGKRDATQFVLEQSKTVTRLIQQVTQHQPVGAGFQATAASPAHPCPICSKALLRRKSKTGYFWGCSGYPECKHSESYD